jgi:hypothetical protein
MASKLSLYASLLGQESDAKDEVAKEDDSNAKKQSLNAGRTHES